MVSESVSVESASGLLVASEGEAEAAAGAHRWSSDGSGMFTIEEAPSSELAHKHGSKIVMRLKEDCKEYCDAERVKAVVKRYSNFVSFPIRLNGEVCCGFTYTHTHIHTYTH